MLPKSGCLTATFSVTQTIKLWPLLCDKIPWLFRSETFQEQNRLPLVGTLQARVLPIQDRISQYRAFVGAPSLWLPAGAGDNGTPQRVQSPAHVPPSQLELRTLVPCTFDPSTEDIAPALTLKSNLPNLCQVPLPSYGGTPVTARTLQR